MFSIEVREEEWGTVLVLRGELDHDSVVQLDEAGRRATAPGDASAPAYPSGS